jgi:hypothetical protein
LPRALGNAASIEHRSWHMRVRDDLSLRSSDTERANLLSKPMAAWMHHASLGTIFFCVALAIPALTVWCIGIGAAQETVES